tara:strand:+ start:6744 stop:7010 length:267 start_codon:yes stop_codon:yes gene_type:complete
VTSIIIQYIQFSKIFLAARKVVIKAKLVVKESITGEDELEKLINKNAIIIVINNPVNIIKKWFTYDSDVIFICFLLFHFQNPYMLIIK